MGGASMFADIMSCLKKGLLYRKPLTQDINKDISLLKLIGNDA